MQTPSSTPAGYGQRHPLLALLGFTLLGLAAAMLIFGGSLLGGPAQESAPPASGLSDTAAILEQARELASPQPAGEIFALQAGVVAAGDRAPDFIVPDLNGQSVRLSDFRGQPVIINFWATWCPPCRVEMPDLEQAYQQYAGDGLVILALDQNEPAQTVADFFDEMGLSFTPLLDINGAIAGMYGVFNFPTSVFVNSSGEVIAVHRGLMSFAQIETYLGQTLSN